MFNFSRYFSPTVELWVNSFKGWLLVKTRILRIQKSLHRVLMDYFLIKSPLSYPGIISVKEIELQSDLKSANVYISVLGTEEDAEQTRVNLDKDRRGILSLVNRRLRMKYCPYFHFFVNHISLPLSPVEETLALLREKNS